MNLKKHKKTFGNLAKDYTKYRKPYTSKVFKSFFSLLSKKSAKILDIACGTGKSTEPLIKRGIEVFGVDHDERMIKEAKNQAKRKGLDISYAVAEVEQLPFEKEIFDAVTVGTAFHWFVNKKAIKEIARVIKPSGLVFIYWTLTTKDISEKDSVPASFYKKYKWERVPPKLRDLAHIKTFLEKNGFSDVSTVQIPFKHNDTIEDQVGLMKTASAYELLSPEDKNKFVKELTTIRKEGLGKRKYFTFEEEIQICYGYKK